MNEENLIGVKIMPSEKKIQIEFQKKENLKDFVDKCKGRLPSEDLDCNEDKLFCSLKSINDTKISKILFGLKDYYQRTKIDEKFEIDFAYAGLLIPET